MRFLFSTPIPYGLTRFILGFVFVYSGLSKALDPDYFAGVINAFGILPQSLTFPAAIFIVILELGLGAGIILDKRGSLSGLLIMLLGFMGVAGYAIYMGYDIDCGCFGPGDPAGEAFSHLHGVLYRDGGMLIGIAYLYKWRHWNQHSPSPLFLSKAKKTN